MIPYDDAHRTLSPVPLTKTREVKTRAHQVKLPCFRHSAAADTGRWRKTSKVWRVFPRSTFARFTFPRSPSIAH